MGASRRKLAAVDPAELLRTARWHAALTQDDVASRAGTSQQAVARYEQGATCPSFATLERLVAACGMRLSVTLVPQPGLEDQPTRELLRAAPLHRLPSRYRTPTLALARSLAGARVPHLVAGKAAARLLGAVARPREIELWLPLSTDKDALLMALVDAEAFDIDAGRVPLSDLPLLPFGPPVEVFVDGPEGAVELRLRLVKHFEYQHARGVDLRLDDVDVRLAGPDDLPAFWHPRDRDRLTLQRALRVAKEDAHPNSPEVAWGAPLQRAPGLEWTYTH